MHIILGHAVYISSKQTHLACLASAQNPKICQITGWARGKTKKNYQGKPQKIYRKIVATKLEGERGKALVAGSLKKNFFEASLRDYIL